MLTCIDGVLEIEDEEERDMLIEMIEYLDAEFLKAHNEKQEQERKKAETKKRSTKKPPR